MRLAVLLFLCLCTSLCADDAEQQPREAIVQGSRLRAEATKVFQLAAAQRTETKVARLFQMKYIFRRFDAVLVDPVAEKRTVMRPLTRALHTYSDPQQGIQDGAIFGFTTDGTNPDALLSARRSEVAQPSSIIGSSFMTPM